MLLALASTPASLSSTHSTNAWTKVVSGGFGDSSNVYGPGVAEFDDHLYVGTMKVGYRAGIEGATTTLNTGGEIWRTYDGIGWEQIGADGLGNPNNQAIRLVTFKNKLYAGTPNFNEGLEIWVSSDGRKFTQMISKGFGDKDNMDCSFTVYMDRLIVSTFNVRKGMEIWVLEDGDRFERVVQGGLGDSGNTGPAYYLHPGGHLASQIITFKGLLYVGTINPTSGGEIWRTSDELRWERVADNGLTSPSYPELIPAIVFRDQLYVIATNRISSDTYGGIQVFRSSDAKNWERVVEDGFGFGARNNIAGTLYEFDGALYLITNNQDRRVLTHPPVETSPPKGFQLWTSRDGKSWTQVIEPGFNNDNNIVASMLAHDGSLYIGTENYRDGSELWRSKDSRNWEMIFKEKPGTIYNQGAEVIVFKSYLYVFISNLWNGLEAWRHGPIETVRQTTTAEVGTTSTQATSTQTFPLEGSTTSNRMLIMGALAAIIIAAIAVVALKFRKKQVGVDRYKFCIECGNQLPVETEFCPKCGQRQS